MAKVITESKNPERDAEILKALEATAAKEVGEMFGLSASSTSRIAKRQKESRVFDLSITDGVQTVPVGQIMTSKGFHHACRRAMREFSSFFDRLELPQWRLVSGEEEALLTYFKEEAA